MRLIVLSSILVLAIAGLVYGELRPYESTACNATGAIFVGKDREFNCSGTEIGSTKDGGGIFLTARHCVADADTNELNENMSVSFSENQAGPFYDAEPVAISSTDDLALLYLRNGAGLPSVKVRDNRRLSAGDSIFNVSFPLGTGKQVFHGEYMRGNFAVYTYDGLTEYAFWRYAMPMNLTIAHGSSGSGIFSRREHALVGVAVGTFEEGSFNIAIPSNRVLYFLNDLKDNTVDKFVQANPIKAGSGAWFGFRNT